MTTVLFLIILAALFVVAAMVKRAAGDTATGRLIYRVLILGWILAFGAWVWGAVLRHG